MHSLQILLHPLCFEAEMKSQERMTVIVMTTTLHAVKCTVIHTMSSGPPREQGGAREKTSRAKRAQILQLPYSF